MMFSTLRLAPYPELCFRDIKRTKNITTSAYSQSHPLETKGMFLKAIGVIRGDNRGDFERDNSDDLEGLGMDFDNNSISSYLKT